MRRFEQLELPMIKATIYCSNPSSLQQIVSKHKSILCPFTRTPDSLLPESMVRIVRSDNPQHSHIFTKRTTQTKHTCSHSNSFLLILPPSTHAPVPFLQPCNHAAHFKRIMHDASVSPSVRMRLITAPAWREREGASNGVDSLDGSG
jgi:hypothetical protein